MMMLANTICSQAVRSVAVLPRPLALPVVRHLTVSSLRFQVSPPPLPSSSSANVGRTTRVQNKELPSVPNTLPYLAAFVAAAIASWGGFTIYATNKEKLSSSIFKSVLGQIKNSPQVLQLLSNSETATSIVLKRETWLAGMCRVKGSVNMMQGRVDLSFQITTAPEGTAQVATVYFTSIRAHKHAPFEILRFLVINNTTAQSVNLLDHSNLSTIDINSGDIL